MQRAAVRILHPASSPAGGPLERALSDARRANADRLVDLFRSAGADHIEIVTGPPEAGSFGARLRGLVGGLPSGAGAAGLIVLGSGSIPLAARRDAADFAAVAGSGERRALTNNRYSADVVAIGAAAILASVPDLPSDNALPRWLEDEAGFEVQDLARRWRLAVDLDSPLDVLVAERVRARLPTAPAADVDVRGVLESIDQIRAVAADPSAELIVAGRTSSATLRWLERHTASRTRALIEERGLRAVGRPRDERAQRPPRSVLGLVLDERGPSALGALLAELGDAAIVDSRVLLAHRLGADESGWPTPEDRFASDLLLADAIRDPWLRELTASARDSAIPVLLGGHTLVGPGVRTLLGRRR